MKQNSNQNLKKRRKDKFVNKNYKSKKFNKYERNEFADKKSKEDESQPLIEEQKLTNFIKSKQD